MSVKFFLIMGPSGSGKGTIEKTFRARHPEFHYALSATTRPRREGEGDEVYRFVSEEEFDRMVENDELIEWAFIHNQQRSGIIKKPVQDALSAGRSVIREIEILSGWGNIMKGEFKDRVRSIFLIPPSMEALETRIRRRSNLSEAEIARRLETTKKEMRLADRADFQVLSEENEQEKIYKQVEEYILGEAESAAGVLKIVSIDELKKALPGYSPERADEFQSESAKIANKLFDDEIKTFHGKKVVLMSGGSASGKTEFLEKFFPESFDGLVFDSTLSTVEGADIKIQRIQESHNTPVVCLILPDDLRRAFTAFHRRERIIPEHRFCETHSGARKTILWIAETYPSIDLLIYENTYDPSNVEEDGLSYVRKGFDSREQMVDFLRSIQYSEDEIRTIVS